MIVKTKMAKNNVEGTSEVEVFVVCRTLYLANIRIHNDELPCCQAIVSRYVYQEDVRGVVKELQHLYNHLNKSAPNWSDNPTIVASHLIAFNPLDYFAPMLPRDTSRDEWNYLRKQCLEDNGACYTFDLTIQKPTKNRRISKLPQWSLNIKKAIERYNTLGMCNETVGLETLLEKTRLKDIDIENIKEL